MTHDQTDWQGVLNVLTKYALYSNKEDSSMSYFPQFMFLYGSMALFWIYGIVMYITISRKVAKEEAEGGNK